MNLHPLFIKFRYCFGRLTGVAANNHNNIVTAYLDKTIIYFSVFVGAECGIRAATIRKSAVNSRRRNLFFGLATHPLFTYTEPERVNDMVKSFIAFYEQNGRLPVWNFYGSETDMMIGYHAVPVIADAYLKGIGDFDAEKALAASINTPNPSMFTAFPSSSCSFNFSTKF